MEKRMTIPKFARTAAAAVALAMLPVHAAAAAPSTLPVLAAGVAAQDDPSTESDEGQPFFQSDYLIPTVIVIVLALVLYFALEDDEEQTGGGVSP
jgi:RsiW-degrading membrane proteinase PrsW (M82 family)